MYSIWGGDAARAPTSRSTHSGPKANLEAAALAQQRVAQDARGLPVRTMDSLLGGDFASRLYTSTMDDLDTLDTAAPQGVTARGVWVLEWVRLRFP